MTTPTQKIENKTIHPQQCKEMIIQKQKLLAQRNLRNKAIREKAAHRRGKEGNEIEYTKDAEKTDITQLVAARREMPEEMELNRESRKQLAELMLEYPTRIDKQEEAEETEQRRQYTCINCKMPFKTPMGKPNHLRNKPECRQVPQKGTFPNQCPDCNRTFKGENMLREHKKYICTRPEEMMTHAEQVDVETLHSSHEHGSERQQEIQGGTRERRK